MNDDFFRYKIRFFTFALLLGYAIIHTHLTGTYTDVSLSMQIDFTARMPFGQRVLVPALAHLMAMLIPLQVDHIFFLLEWMWVFFFYLALKELLKREFSVRQSQFLSWLFILLLPLMTVINFRYTSGGESTFFYSYDTASLFFLTVGFMLCLKEQWLYLIPWIFLATFNRESSILLVLLIPALHWQKPKTYAYPLLASFIAYGLARGIILSILKDIPGHTMEFFTLQKPITHFAANMYWLFNSQHILMFIFCVGALPFLWFVFYDYIPPRYRPVRFVTVFYFLGLLLVGIFREARLFSEIGILLYLPLCLALRDWLTGNNPLYFEPDGILSLINRYVVIGVLLFVAVFHQPLNNGLLWLLAP